MAEHFFEQPILNSPYVYPARHWELDDDGQPSNRILEVRRPAKFVTPVPKPRRRQLAPAPIQTRMVLDEGLGLSTDEQQYGPTSIMAGWACATTIWRRRCAAPPRSPRARLGSSPSS